jgi:hypothetical protein
VTCKFNLEPSNIIVANGGKLFQKNGKKQKSEVRSLNSGDGNRK